MKKLILTIALVLTMTTTAMAAELLMFSMASCGYCQAFLKEVAAAKTAITENVSTAITGMGDALRTLPTGEQVVESRDFFIKRIKQERSALLVEV